VDDTYSSYYAWNYISKTTTKKRESLAEWMHQ
jgi:hypothetical protein